MHAPISEFDRVETMLQGVAGFLECIHQSIVRQTAIEPSAQSIVEGLAKDVEASHLRVDGIERLWLRKPLRCSYAKLLGIQDELRGPGLDFYVEGSCPLHPSGRRAGRSAAPLRAQADAPLDCVDQRVQHVAEQGARYPNAARRRSRQTKNRLAH